MNRYRFILGSLIVYLAIVCICILWIHFGLPGQLSLESQTESTIKWIERLSKLLNGPL